MKRKHVVSLLSAVLSCGLLGGVAVGAEPGVDGMIASLEEVVVTATRTEHDLETAPGRIQKHLIPAAPPPSARRAPSCTNRLTKPR